MQRILTTVLFTALCCGTGFAHAAEPKLDSPLLFCKRLNYQGLHIYDTFYQWRHTGTSGGGIYVRETGGTIRPVIDANTAPTLGNGIYFNPSLSYDAKKLLFSYKGEPQGNSTIYEIGIDGKNLRQISNLDKNGNPYKGSGSGHHDVRPCYLPDGRIVFTSTRYSGLVPCANNGVAILHICNADGSDVHTISVNNVTEFDPAVMPDGRILFGRWEYIDKNALTIQSLWTVNPDGTNETALYANNMVFPEAVLQAKPVPGSSHLVVGTFAPHNAPPRGSIAMVDTRKGKNDPAAIFNFEHHDKPTFDRGDSCDPWALDENTVIYSGLPSENDSPKTTLRGRNPKLNALIIINRTGKKTTLLTDTQFDLHNPIPVVERPLPRVLSDATDRKKITGNFFVQNVYANLPNTEKGAVKWLRVVEETSRVSESPGGTWMNQTFSISAALAWSPKIYHGIVPVEKDGSVYFEAPSGRALYFQLLDKDYRLIRSMRTFIQAAPGTTRSCVGCHEYEKAPQAGTPVKFLGKDPLKPAEEVWGSGYVDYPSMIQPILDKKCIECHGEKKLEGGLDLTGGWTEYFNISYETLTARREKQYISDLIAGICCMNGTADYSCKIFEPYQHGSGKASLAELLLRGEHRSLLTDKERQLIFAWIDSNGIYYGTWDYTPSGPRLNPYAEVRNELIGVMKQNGCVDCHGDHNKNIARFDHWINLEKPERSLILRAPLKNDLQLCRNRNVDASFSTRGIMFKAGYAHQVLPLDKFPTQRWIPWAERQKGEAVFSFEDTKDPVYQLMLSKIQTAQKRVLANPRVDMPAAAYTGRGIIAGRSRQIIPQPLPEKLPTLNIEMKIIDDESVVHLTWERSAQTIGLITEIHRSDKPNFTPSPETKIGQTERFEYYDTLDGFSPNSNGAGRAYYAAVFVSDPAATCGTCKSGSVLDYQHTK